MIELGWGAKAVDIELTMEFAERQVRRLVEKYPGFYPMYTHGGKWKHDLPAWTRWCDGFLPGMMWIFWERHPEGSQEKRWWFDKAVEYSRPLEPRKQDREVHDLGFIFLTTFLPWYEATGEEWLRQVLIEAGRTLSLRFSEKGRFLRSFVAPNSVFIDIMMNVPLIFYAATQTGEGELWHRAMEHCLTTRRFLVRGDGSTAHEGIFDLETGEFLRQSTQQGYRADSCWSRGLAWALHGFAKCYSYTHDGRFLQTADMCADYYIRETPSDGVPPWDYDAPEESRKLVDTSAAAIAAAGLLKLADLHPDPARKALYVATSRRILGTLCSSYLAESDGEWEGILKGGVYHLHKGLGVNESVMWGEYYFVQALDLLRREPGC